VPGYRITELPAITGATIAATDLIETVDTSNTTDHPTGSSFKTTYADAAQALGVAAVEFDNGVLAGAATINCANGARQRMTASGFVTLTFTNAHAGVVLDLLVVSTPPAYITFPAGSKMPGGVIPPLTGYDRILASFDGTNWTFETGSSTADPLGTVAGIDPLAVPFGASRMCFEAGILALPPTPIAGGGVVAAGATLVTRAGTTGTLVGSAGSLLYPFASTGYVPPKFNPNVLLRAAVRARTAGNGLTFTPAAAFGFTSPFTVILCVNPAALTFNGALVSFLTTAGNVNRLSWGRAGSAGTIAANSASGFTNFQASAAPSAPFIEAAETPTVWSFLWNGTNATSNTTSGINMTLRCNGNTAPRTNGGQFDPQMSAQADTISLGRDPAATWADNAQDLIGFYFTPTLLDFSTPYSPGVAIERRFAARAGLPTNVMTVASPL